MARITLTLGELLEAEAALGRLSDHVLPAFVSYRLAKLMAAVQAEAAPLVTSREALFRRYGDVRDATPDERQTFQSPQVISVAADHREAFTQEYATLLAEPVTLAVVPFDLADLPSSVLVSARDVFRLGSLVTCNGHDRSVDDA